MRTISFHKRKVVQEALCSCSVHLNEEKKDGKKYINCLGHGKGCPCTKKLKQNENINSK